MFDVSVGAYDRPEVRELVGTCLLNLLSKKNNLQVYGDDGLTILKNCGPQSEQVKRKTSKKCLRNMSIESRLSTISFNEKIFQEAVPPYQNAL